MKYSKLLYPVIAIAICLSLYRYSWADNFSVGCFQGLNDTDSPATIGDCEAQSALNVEPNKNGTAIKKRLGFSREASLTIASSPASGSHSFLADNGNRIDVVCHDVICAASTNGAAFSNFIATNTAGITRWSFVSVDGDLYGANTARMAVMKFDGTNLSHSTGIPQGTILELTNDRLVVSDTSANPNRVCYSASGAFENFVTALANESAWCDDLGAPGERTTGLKFDSGILYRFTNQSITACEIGNQYNTKCDILANYIGTRDPASIITTPAGIMFKGNDGHFWVISAGRLSKLSDNIATLVGTQPQGSQRNNTTNGQADWEASTNSMTGYWNTDTIPGSIFPSSNTFVDTSSTDFSAGTLTNLATGTVIGSLQLSSTSVREDFTDSDYPNYDATNQTFATLTGGPLDWTANGGIQNGRIMRLSDSGISGITPTNTTPTTFATTEVQFTTGSINFDWAYVGQSRGSNFQCGLLSGNAVCLSLNFMIVDGSNYYALQIWDGPSATSNRKVIKFSKYVATVETVLASSTTEVSDVTPHEMQVVRNDGGHLYFYMDGVQILAAVDTTYLSGTSFSVYEENGCGGECAMSVFANLHIWGYQPHGNIVSRIFDTTISNPVGGTFNSTFTIHNATSSIAFYTRSSTSPYDEAWTSWAATTDTLRIGERNRYWEYRALFQTYSSTLTPQINDVSLIAATTGQYHSQCIQTGSGISSWGILSCAETKTGAAALNYYVRTDTTCVTLSTAIWTAHTNNATIAISAGEAFQFRFDSLLYSATEQAQVNACTVYWNEGSVAPPTWGIYDPVNDLAFWAITSGNLTANNRLLRYDLRLNSWLPWDISLTAPLIKDKAFYFGSSSGGYWNRYGLTHNDNGSDINSYWKSKDWGAGLVFQEKGFEKISTVARNQQAGTIDVSYTDSQGNTGTYTIDTDTDSTKSYIRNNQNLPVLSPSTFLNVQYGNDSQYPWEVDGYRLDYSVLPWRAMEQ